MNINLQRSIRTKIVSIKWCNVKAIFLMLIFPAALMSAPKMLTVERNIDIFAQL
jgi:hypothetical protein